MKFDCIIIEDEKMSRDLLENMIDQNSNLTLLGSFEDPIEAVNFLSSTKVDLIFLDVEMPELNGFEVLDSLSYMPHIILTTSKKDYAYQGYEYKLEGFLLKPFTFPKFLSVVGSLLQEMKITLENEKSPCNESIFVKKDGVYENVPFDKILHIEAFGDFVKIHTTEKRIVTRSTMKEIEDGISKLQFMRVHRSFIVNLSKVTGIEDNALIINKAILPIGKMYRTEFFERINLL